MSPAICLPPAFLLLLLLSTAKAALTPQELADALDSGSSISWRAAGIDWPAVTEAAAHDGVDTIRTPQIQNSEDAGFSGEVTGPGTLQGWVKVSSEKDHDVLEISVNEAVLKTFSGEKTEDFAVPIGLGRQTVSFTWRKDASRIGGADAAWLDSVVFVPQPMTLADALDVTGTPSASRVVLSTPPGSVPWTGATVGSAAINGGNVLFSAARRPPEPCVLQASVHAPSVLIVRARRHGGEYEAGALEVKAEGADSQAFSVEEPGGWTRWQVLLPKLPASVLLTHYGRGEYDPPREAGYFLDDLSVQTLTPVPVADALDSPGLTFTTAWKTPFGGTPPVNQPWLSAAISGDTGNLTSQGADAVFSQPPLFTSSSGFESYTKGWLSTAVTGPGRINFRWKAVGDLHSNLTRPGLSITDSANPDLVTGPSLPLPVSSEWQQHSVEIPAGSRTVSWVWNGSDYGLALDTVTWTPTPRILPPPSTSNALDVTGSINISSTGNWTPVQWNGAGFGNDDALTWKPLAAPFPDGPPLTVSVTGPGWLSFAFYGNGLIGFAVDGVEEDLYPSGDAGDTVWEEKARLLPAGAHTLAWRPKGDAATWPEGTFRLDALRFQAAPPAWVAAVEGTGLTDFQTSGGPWPVVTDITHDGTSALRTPAVGAKGNASLKTKLTGPGTLHFWWKLSEPAPSPGWHNALSLDPAIPGGAGNWPSLIGDSGWKEVVLDLPGITSYAPVWIFNRSDSATLPGDGAWLDQMTWTPATATSLGEALDAPGLTWTSSGPFQPLTGGGLTKATGGDAVKLPSANFPDPVWIQTTVNGPGFISILYSGVSVFGSNPEILVDGVPVMNAAGSYGSGILVSGAGPHTWRLAINSYSYEVELDDFQFIPLPVVSLAEALDNPQGATLSISNSSLGSLNTGVASPAAAHDGSDAVRLENFESSPNPVLEVAFTGPARIRFWWRAEGSTDPQSYVSAGSFQQSGTFGWEEKEFVSTTEGSTVLQFSCRTPFADHYLLWIDQLRIDPLDAVSLTEALHAAPLNFVTGGDGGVWKGHRPPGSPGTSDGAYAAVGIPGNELRSAWLETTVTGPGFLRYAITSDSSLPFTITRQGTGDATPVNITSATQPILIPLGQQTIRWSVQRSYATDPSNRLTALLKDVSFTLPHSVAEALDTTGLTFTTAANPDSFWYGAPKGSLDAETFAGDDLLQLLGTGDLTFTVTGPGWLHMQAGVPKRSDSTSWPPDTGMAVRLLPPAPAPVPDPLPAPVMEEAFPTIYYGNFKQELLWIPNGPWQVLISGKNALTLNQLSFEPALNVQAAAAALELPAGLSVSLPGTSGGATIAPVSHDGTDALQIFGSAASTDPLVSFSFTGPALLSGWLRSATAVPFPGSVWQSPVPGVDGLQTGSELHLSLDGTPFAMPLPEPGEEGWWPLRLPVTGSGPHVLSFALTQSRNSIYDYQLLQLDEIALSPLLPVSLATALDTSGLTWATGGPEWSGWASPIASPDATDAAWLLMPRSQAEPPGIVPPAWLETTVTGPGTLRLAGFGPGTLRPPGFGTANLSVNLGSAGTLDLSEAWTRSPDRWADLAFLVPPGPQTVRLTMPADLDYTTLLGLDQGAWEPGGLATLANALDLPAGSTVSVSGADAAGFQGYAVPGFSHDGTDAVIFRGPTTSVASMETTVTGPALVSFWQASDNYAHADFTVDGEPPRQQIQDNGGGIIIGVVGHAARAVAPPVTAAAYNFPPLWSREEFFISAGPHILRWTPVPAGTASIALSVDDLTVTPLDQIVSLAQAVDQPGWTVTTNRPDKVRAFNLPAASHDATDAVLLIGDNYYDDSNQPALTVMVPGPGILHFRWRPVGQTFFGPRLEVTGGTTAQELDCGQPDGPWRSACVVIPQAGLTPVTLRRPGDGHGVWVDEITLDPGLSPAAATGAPGLNWTTGGSAPWLGIPKPIKDYDSSFLPVPYAEASVRGGSDAWMEATLTGPGRLVFTSDFTPNAFVLFDGNPLQGLLYNNSSEYAVTTFTLVVPPGAHRVRWMVKAPPSPTPGLAGQVTIKSVKFTPSVAVDPIAEALDAPLLPWIFPGTADVWRLDTANTSDGVDALRLDGASSWIATVLPAPGKVTMKVHGEGHYAEPGPEWNTIDVRHDDPAPRRVEFHPLPNYNPATSPDRVWVDQFTYTSASVTLADALDAPGQTWTTSSTSPFIGYAASGDRTLANDLTDAVMASGGTDGAWLETTVTGPALVSFWTGGYGGAFSLDGIPIALQDTTGWAPLHVETGPGLHTLRWVKSGTTTWAIDQFSVTPRTAGQTLADALDFPGPWIVETPEDWSVSATDTHDGQDAAFFNNSRGSVGVYVDGPGRLQFYSKGSWYLNEKGYPRPLVESPDTPAEWHGLHFPEWTLHTIDTIPPGRHLLRWPVDLWDYDASPGTVGLDQVSFTRYQNTSLVASLDTAGLTLTTNPAAPWQGWLTGAAADDGTDAAVSSGSPASWLAVTVPAGAGELRFLARAPGALSRALNASQGENTVKFPVPETWKQIVFPVSASGPRDILLAGKYDGPLWLDRMSFVSASTILTEWLTTQGLPAAADLLSDSDSDGYSLLMEYAFGLNPNGRGTPDPAVPGVAGPPVFTLAPRSNNTSSLRCTYVRRTGGTGLRYEVLFAGNPATPLDLSDYGASTTIQSLNNEWELVTVDDATFDYSYFPNTRFGRVRVTLRAVSGK